MNEPRYRSHAFACEPHQPKPPGFKFLSHKPRRFSLQQNQVCCAFLSSPGMGRVPTSMQRRAASTWVPGEWPTGGRSEADPPEPQVPGQVLEQNVSQWAVTFATPCKAAASVPHPRPACDQVEQERGQTQANPTLTPDRETELSLCYPHRTAWAWGGLAGLCASVTFTQPPSSGNPYSIGAR